MKLSILFGTFNRFVSLERCIASCRAGGVAEGDYEIVVCDGGSTDGSREWLAAQSDVVLVGLRHLGGAVEAFNACYRVARGDYLATLNDDVTVRPGAFAAGLARFDDPLVGQVAFNYTENGGPPHCNLIHPPNHYYANYGIIRGGVARTVESITGGLWNPCYLTYGADTELSVWVHRLGWKVQGAPDAIVDDHHVDDELRARNHANDRALHDGQRFWRRWHQIDLQIKPGGPLPAVSFEEQDALRAWELGRYQ